MAHKPWLASQVIGDLILIFLTPEFCASTEVSSSNKCPFSKSTFPSFLMSSCKTLPKILSDTVWITEAPSIIASTVMPSSVPQSSDVITTSCETSTSLLVKYPEFAVLSAVSARPFRAP